MTKLKEKLENYIEDDLFTSPVYKDFDNEPFTVSEISKKIKANVEMNFSNIKIRGEISGYKVHPSGHKYFSLKDSNQESVIRAICWRGTKTKADLKEGIEIVASGNITTYQATSVYQIIVSQAEVFGEGALEKLLKERREKFQAEGLFDKKNKLPKYPETIGIITSKTGAVLQDILNILRGNKYPCTVILWNVLVQGNDAARQIANAIKGFNRLEKKPDVLIVARGGGSIEDLWCFNEEIVVRETFASTIPVIAAIGHETDFTLIEEAADYRAPTPTAAAVIATPTADAIKEKLMDYRKSMFSSVNKIIKFNQIDIKLKKLPKSEQFFQERFFRLDDFSEKLIEGMDRLQYKRSSYFNLIKSKIKAPMNIRAFEIKHSFIWKNITQKINYKILDSVRVIEHLGQLLEKSSYNSILNKGFCLATSGENNVLRTKSQLVADNPDKIILHFIDGNLTTKPDFAV